MYFYNAFSNIVDDDHVTEKRDFFLPPSEAILSQRKCFKLRSRAVRLQIISRH